MDAYWVIGRRFVLDVSMEITTCLVTPRAAG